MNIIVMIWGGMMSSPLSQLQCKRSLVANDGDANDGVFLQMIEMFLTPLYVCMYECMYVCMYVCMHACMYVYRRLGGVSRP